MVKMWFIYKKTLDGYTSCIGGYYNQEEAESILEKLNAESDKLDLGFTYSVREEPARTTP